MAQAQRLLGLWLLLLIEACGGRNMVDSDQRADAESTEAPHADAEPLGESDASSDAGVVFSGDSGRADSGPVDSGGPLPPVTCAGSTSEPVLLLVLRGVLFTDLHGDLYRFDPERELLTKLGTLDCPAPEGAFPYSMAADRDGIVWVYYWYDGVYRVDPADMSCSATPYITEMAGSSELPFVFSMAFGGGSESEPQTLFAALTNPQFSKAPCPFGYIDPFAPEATELGTLGASADEYLALASESGSDGRLFALGSESTWEVDVSTGQRSSEMALPHARQSWPTGWTFWGGHAYLFGHFGLSNDPLEIIRYSRGAATMDLLTTLRPGDGEIMVALGAGSGKCRDSESTPL